MNRNRILMLAGWVFSSCFPALAQRNYSAASVLASGNWYKLAIQAPGIYKMDVPFLNSLGINTTNLSSGSVRLFGNGGQMLPEANNGPYMDDLKENSILVVDGGDGLINGSDYILFYASGPDEWVKDSVNLGFMHKKNIYSDRSYYFLTIGGVGKRISTGPLLGSPTVTITGFSGRYFHELDTVNFLSSGKEWFGEEMSNLPGRSLVRTFPVDLPGFQHNSSLLLRVNCAARSVGAGSRFDLSINNQAAGQLSLGPVGGGPYDLFAQQAMAVFSAPGQTSNRIGFSFVPGGFNAQGWLNWFEVFARQDISLDASNQLLFRDWLSVGNNRGEFVVGNAGASTQVWEVTDPLNPVKMPGTLSSNEFRFVNDCSRLREYAAFNPSGLPAPVFIGPVSNQNLHNSTATDLLIVTHSSLLGQAQRIADFHRQHDQLRVMIVTTDQVFNEFGSGSPDPTAIRDFVKMYWDRYGAPPDKLRYLLLFGDGSFDYRDRIKNNTLLVPAYQVASSLDPLSTYTSDDFFGFLDDNEDINSGSITNLLDIGIGRIPAKNAEEAKNFTDKLINYFSSQSLGPWRNSLTFIADDEDANLHLQDAEVIASTAETTAPVFNLQKIYLDAYRQESGPGGSHYPQANQAINNQVYNGTLIWNYNGHGGASRLAEETIVDQAIVNTWNNAFRLPLFITATCDFAPFDNPAVSSLGENILLRPQTGAIALMTTTRPVFAFSNRIMNNNYLQTALQPDASGRFKSLGDAVKEGKNFTYQSLGDVANNRKFTLLGDPAMTLGFPFLKARATRVNGIPAAQADTLGAGELVIMEGEITDIQGNLLTNFNGNVYPVVFDKPQTINTLGNDPGSPVTTFQIQNNILFKGRASVTNGKFNFSFKVPRDINYRVGNGKLSLYAEDGTRDAGGYFTNFLVGGTGLVSSPDREGPEIRPFLNDEMFVNGGITDQGPILIVKLADTSGINTAGTGIGHDIVATLDNDNRKYFILNDFYQGDLNSYQKGTVRFQMPELDPGPHTLRIKAWDVLNNSNEALLEFTVADDQQLVLNHVLNYPNPFTSQTIFWFEHNKPGLPLQVRIQVMTITGRVVKTINETVITTGNRSAEIKWDGRDDSGDKLGRGVYLYKIRVSAPGNLKKEVLEKLVIL